MKYCFLVVFSLHLCINSSLFGQFMPDSSLNNLRFISAERKPEKDSIIQFYNNALLFLKVNSTCIINSFQDKFQKLDLSEIYYKSGEISNNKMYKKGFLEKIKYKTYLNLKGEENLLLRKCINKSGLPLKNKKEFTNVKKGFSPIHFSEVLNDGNYFYFQGSLNRKDISVIIYFRFSSFSNLDYCSLEEVIY